MAHLTPDEISKIKKDCQKYLKATHGFDSIDIMVTRTMLRLVEVIERLESRLAKYEAQPLYTAGQIIEAFCEGHNDSKGITMPEHLKVRARFYEEDLPPFTPEAADA